jgi:hypothetical protein
MNTQNITLSLPRDILTKVKLIAVQREMSVSGLLTAELEKLVAQEEMYSRAQQRHLQWLEHAPDLGTKGHIDGTRNELHER